MRILVFLFVVAFALPVQAQLTLDELDTIADETDAAMTEFRRRLNDPDPDRALAVLKALVTRGDAAQRRLAIRHGLESTDRAVRATVLRAIFDSAPTLRVVFDPAAEKPSVYYFRSISDAGGVLDAEGNGSVTFKLNGYNTEKACWTHGSSKSCLLRMRGDTVSAWFGRSWGNYELDGTTGRLVGEQAISKNLTSAFIDLSE